LDNNVRLLNGTGIILSKNDINCLMPKTCKDAQEINDPISIVKHLLEVVDHDELLELYEISDFDGHLEFLENIAKKTKLVIKVNLDLIHFLERIS
jgi:hypothetical protein